jgi:hypothetical protein
MDMEHHVLAQSVFPSQFVVVALLVIFRYFTNQLWSLLSFAAVAGHQNIKRGTKVKTYRSRPRRQRGFTTTKQLFVFVRLVQTRTRLVVFYLSTLSVRGRDDSYLSSTINVNNLITVLKLLSGLSVEAQFAVHIIEPACIRARTSPRDVYSGETHWLEE